MVIHDTFMYVIESYGWYLLLFGVLFAYFYQKVLKTRVDVYMKGRSEEEYVAKYHKNPDLFMARQVAQQEYAAKLQEKYQREAEEFQRKQDEKEAKKREEFLEKHDGKGGGTKLGSKDDKSKSESKSFKPEFNPLMGSGSSSNYRPPKRSACSRGGCG